MMFPHSPFEPPTSLSIPVDPSLMAVSVNSCMLATLVLANIADSDDSLQKSMITCARNVLKYWGIEPKQEAPDPKAKPAPSATLVWPPVDRLGRPLSVTLPDVYRENYYHVLVTGESGMDGTLVNPEDQLVLVDAYWNKESLQWRMQFDAPGNRRIWVDHCKVRVGDEIPKERA